VSNLIYLGVILFFVGAILMRLYIEEGPPDDED
jgi:hypothetical protein